MAQQVAGSILSSYRGHLTSVSSLSWSSDGMRIVSAGNDKTVHVWHSVTGNSHHLFQDEANAVRIVAWSTDGTRIVTVGDDAVARVWDVTTNYLITNSF
jgi:WD40 repeat protein